MRVGHVAVVLWAHAPAGPDAGGPASPFRRARLALVAEALLPLVGTLDRLQRDGLSLPITMALSPALWAGLEHPLVQAELDADLEQAVRLAAEEVERTRSSPAFHRLAGWHQARVEALAGLWQVRCDRRPLATLAEHAGAGRLELAVCPATHAVLPLLTHTMARQLQVGAALDAFEGRFGHRPRGMYLPGGACPPDAEQALADAGVDYIVVAPARPTSPQDPAPARRARPSRGPFGLVRVPTDATAISALEGRCRQPAFAAVPHASGDPGDGRADPLRTGRPLHPARFRGAAAPGGPPRPYDPEAAASHVSELATQWLDETARRLAEPADASDGHGLAVAAFDVRRFGAWWLEGSQLLEAMARAVGPSGLHFTALGEYLDDHPPEDPAPPLAGAAVETDYAAWVDRSTAWMHHQLYVAQERLLPMAGRAVRFSRMERRVFAQALHELLFAQASDWTRLVASGVAVDAAVERFRGHLAALHGAADELEKGRVDRARLAERERLVPSLCEADRLLELAVQAAAELALATEA